jgi:hypothetical protein
MKQSSSLFLRAAVATIGLIVLALCIFVLPAVIRDENAGGYRYILLGLYVPAIPFFVALYQAMNLLNYIDTNKAFSDLSVTSLHTIKNCALAITALFAAGMPYIYIVADRDDAPGVILIGLVIMGASLVIATFAAVLQRLLKNAIAIKSENDFTV